MTALNITQAVADLKLQGVPTESVIQSAQHLNDLQLTPAQALEHLERITGEKVEGTHVMFIPLTYGYLVQNIIKTQQKQFAVNPTVNELLATSKKQAEALIEKQAWMFIVDENSHQDIENADPEVVKAGKAKKGARKVLALKVYRDRIEGKKELTRKEAIAILCEEVGLTSAGASTYLANFKNGSWK